MQTLTLQLHWRGTIDFSVGISNSSAAQALLLSVRLAARSAIYLHCLRRNCISLASIWSRRREPYASHMCGKTNSASSIQSMTCSKH